MESIVPKRDDTQDETPPSDEQELTAHLHRALVNDGWEGHPDPLTDDDVLAIAETAAAAALRFRPAGGDDRG